MNNELFIKFIISHKYQIAETIYNSTKLNQSYYNDAMTEELFIQQEKEKSEEIQSLLSKKEDIQMKQERSYYCTKWLSYSFIILVVALLVTYIFNKISTN